MEVIPKDHQERHAAEKIDLNKPVTLVHITTSHRSPTHPAQNRGAVVSTSAAPNPPHPHQSPRNGLSNRRFESRRNSKLAGRAAKSIKSLMTVEQHLCRVARNSITM